MHDILGRQRASVALCLDVGRKSQSSPGLPESIPKARQTAREQMLDEIKATAMHRHITLDLTRMDARFQKQKTERERETVDTHREIMTSLHGTTSKEQEKEQRWVKMFWTVSQCYTATANCLATRAESTSTARRENQG